MSKAAEPIPAKKASSKTTPLIECVLENVLPVSSDAVIKVKKFKKFLDYDLKTLNITGELQTTIHKNEFTHIKMIVTYQDKKTNKVNYLEIDVLDDRNKKVENTKCTSGCSCPPGYSLYCPELNGCCNCSNYLCINNTGDYASVEGCCDNGVVYGTVTTNTAASGAAAKTGKTIILAGTPVAARIIGSQYTVTQYL